MKRQGKRATQEIRRARIALRGVVTNLLFILGFVLLRLGTEARDVGVRAFGFAYRCSNVIAEI
jgi:hypothetical protein